MRGLAEKALKSWDDEEMGDESMSPFGSKDKGENYSADLEAETEAFGVAMGKKDYAGAAEAFKNMMELCK